MFGRGLARLVRWDEPGMTVAAEVHRPPAVMDQRVVQPAQQHTVVEAGLAAFTPGLDVVGVTPGHRPPAAWVRAAAVADAQCFADCRGEQPLGAPDIEWHPGVV